MSSNDEAKRFALDWVDQRRAWLSDFDLEIWRYAEPAWREYKSARAYVDLLRGEGFDVEEGSGGMPTAFVATWGKGAPVLGALDDVIRIQPDYGLGCGQPVRVIARLREVGDLPAGVVAVLAPADVHTAVR